MGLGLFIGLTFYNVFDLDLLRRAFGVVVVILSTLELSRQVLKNRIQASRPLSKLQSAVCLTLAGIIHGVYTSGGPLLVYFTSRQIPDKDGFRSTLSAVWLILGSIIIVNHIFISRTISALTLKTTVVLIPVLFAGILLGEWLHHRINIQLFRVIVFAILFFSGTSLLFS